MVDLNTQYEEMEANYKEIFIEAAEMIRAAIDKFISEQSQYHNWDSDIISNSLVDGTFGKSWNIKPVDKIAGDVSFIYNIDCINRTIEVEQWQWVTNEEDILMSVSQFEKIISRKQY